MCTWRCESCVCSLQMPSAHSGCAIAQQYVFMYESVFWARIIWYEKGGLTWAWIPAPTLRSASTFSVYPSVLSKLLTVPPCCGTLLLLFWDYGCAAAYGVGLGRPLHSVLGWASWHNEFKHQHLPRILDSLHSLRGCLCCCDLLLALKPAVLVTYMSQDTCVQVQSMPLGSVKALSIVLVWFLWGRANLLNVD